MSTTLIYPHSCGDGSIWTSTNNSAFPPAPDLSDQTRKNDVVVWPCLVPTSSSGHQAALKTAILAIKNPLKLTKKQPSTKVPSIKEGQI